MHFNSYFKVLLTSMHVILFPVYYAILLISIRDGCQVQCLDNVYPTNVWRLASSGTTGVSSCVWIYNIIESQMWLRKLLWFSRILLSECCYYYYDQTCWYVIDHISQKNAVTVEESNLPLRKNDGAIYQYCCVTAHQIACFKSKWLKRALSIS